jgi:hypothetical protein
VTASKESEPRKKLLEGAMIGKDQALAEALAYAHPILHGLNAATVEIIHSEVEGAAVLGVGAGRPADELSGAALRCGGMWWGHSLAGRASSV